jgi:hypothetical protein
MDKEIEDLSRKREELLKRIQEKQRLMELIKNKNIKGGLNEVEGFKKIKAAKKIQDSFRKFLAVKEAKKELEIMKENAKYEFNTALNNMNIGYIFIVRKIQRKFRDFLFKKNLDKLRQFYVNKIKNEFFVPITYERAVELRKILINRLETQKDLKNINYEELINKYFQQYSTFCFTFPDQVRTREENYMYYFQCLEMIKYMENLKDNDLIIKFNKFMLNKNKIPGIINRVNKMELAYLAKTDYSDYLDIDDFEENTILDEIDQRYGYESRQKILEKK